ncbi:MAG: radical SAM protein [Candidatus Omnitrophota bacterium]
MKILLVNPPEFNTSRYDKPSMPSYTPPLGIASLAAVLLREGFDIEVADLLFCQWNKVRRIIEEKSPQVVGITCLTERRASVYRLSRIIKEINPAIKVVLGGVHPFFMYKQILKNLPVDVVVLGEGERTFLNLIRAWEKGISLAEIKGIAFKEDQEVIKNEDVELIEDLDLLPPAAYHLFDLDRYQRYGILRGINYRGKRLEKLRFATVVTSRGCINRCQFCSTNIFWGCKWRKQSARKVIDDLEILSKKYSCGYINFGDDTFTVDQNRVIEICKGILSRKLDLIWDCETHVDFVSAEMLGWMKQAGCFSIAYGVESASATILDTINKKTTVGQILNAFELTREAGIKTKILLMVGNPNESEETISETVRLLERLKPDFRAVQLTMVFPGTALYELAKTKRMINDEYWLTDLPQPYYTAERSRSQLRRWADELMQVGAPKWENLIRYLRWSIEDKTRLRITRKGIHIVSP